MAVLPWEDDALSENTDSAQDSPPCDIGAVTPEVAVAVIPRQLSASEMAALGLPVDDPFWMLPEVFDAYLSEAGQPVQETKTAHPSDEPDPETLGPDAPAAQPIRRATASRAPLPSLDPRKRCPGSEPLPETVWQAVSVIATPRMPADQVRGAAAHLLDWYRIEYERRPAIGDMVLWWWKAARRHVDIRDVWADEMRALWKTDERPDAPDPATASVNAFYGHLAHHAARAFVSAKGHKPDDDVGRALLRGAGFPPPDLPNENRRKRDLRGVEADGPVTKQKSLTCH